MQLIETMVGRVLVSYSDHLTALVLRSDRASEPSAQVPHVCVENELDKSAKAGA